MLLGQLTDAADSFASAVKLAPDEPVLRINYGILLIRQKKYAEAEQQLARAAVELEEYLRLAPGAADAPQVRTILAGLKPANKR